MISTAYTLNPLAGLVGHGQQPIAAFCDGIDMDRLELEAHVRSGDYFATIATQLDRMSQDITTDGNKGELQRLVGDLLYLQQHFEIKKK